MLSDTDERMTGGNAPDVTSQEERSAMERRFAERIYLDFEVDYASDDTFLYAYARNISGLGIFLQTREPEPVGTQLSLRFVIPTTQERLSVDGVVRWVNPFRPGDINNINPGMGIEFTSLTDDERERIVSLIQLIAYLPEEDRQKHLGG